MLFIVCYTLKKINHMIVKSFLLSTEKFRQYDFFSSAAHCIALMRRHRELFFQIQFYLLRVKTKTFTRVLLPPPRGLTAERVPCIDIVS